MATGQLNGICQHLRRTALLQDGAGLTDGQLLESFVRRRDEAAFAALVRRHGPMVLGVCRRALGHAQDAEDAFQATFLVLARKAAAVGQPERVGNWLYGTACRAALEAKAARRRVRERQVSAMPEPAAVDPADSWRELRPVLDRELNRLPDKFRVAVVLCDLEGRPRRDVARQLGIPEGTLSGRLTTARRRLARRLARHGVTLSAGALAAILSQQAASACVPAALVVSTAHTAALLAAGDTAAGLISVKVAALTERVVQAMFMTNLKVTAAFVVGIGLLLGATGLLGHGSLASAAPERPAVAAEDFGTFPTGVQDPAKERVQGGREQPRGPTVGGKLEAVDADKGTVTVSTFDRANMTSTDTTYTLAKDAAVTQDGKKVKLADLKKVARATLILTRDRKEAVSVSVAGATTQTAIKAVDADKHTVTITTRTRQGMVDKVLTVAKDAQVTVEGKEARLADLKAGTVVQLTFSAADADTVIQVRTPTRQRKENE